MRRTLTASLAVGLGLACGIVFWAPAWGQQGQSSGQGASERGQQAASRSDQEREDSADETTRKIDQALRSFEQYRDRSGPNLEQARKEIDRLREELTELIKIRYDLALSLAEIRAEVMAQGPMMAAFAFGPGGYGALAGSYEAMIRRNQQGLQGQVQARPGGPAPAGSAEPASPGPQLSREERQQRRQEALARELRQLHDQLRAEVEQARGNADQVANQLRDLRFQQRHMQAIERERREGESVRGALGAPNRPGQEERDGSRRANEREESPRSNDRQNR
jgi:hypothetical protein